MGGIEHDSNYLSNYKPTRPYIWDELTWCLRKPKAISKWKHLLFLADPDNMIIMYIIVFGTIITIILMWMVTGFEEKPFDIYQAILYYIGALLGFSQPPNITIKNTISRFLFIYYLYSVFFAITVYNTFFLYTFTNIKYEKSAKTWQEIYAHHYQLITSSEFESNLNKQLSFDIINISTFNTIDNTIEYFFENHHVALLESHLHFENTNFEEEIYCLDDSKSCSSYAVSMFVRKDLHLRKIINEIIQNLYEAGIIDLWLKKSMKRFRKKSKRRHLEYIAINTKHFEGVFYIYITFIFTAFIMLLFEHVVHHYCYSVGINSKWRKVLITINKVIDGRRHFCMYNEKAISNRKNAIGLGHVID